MASWLQVLAGTLGGGIGGYLDGKEQQRKIAEQEDERKKQDLWRQHQMDMQNRQFEQTQTQQEYGRTKDVYGLTAPETDLSDKPDVLASFKKFNLPTRQQPVADAPMVAPTTTLPMGEGQAPTTMALPSFGMSAKPAITRQETAEERLRADALATLRKQIETETDPIFRSQLQSALGSFGGVNIPSRPLPREGNIIPDPSSPTGARQDLYSGASVVGSIPAPAPVDKNVIPPNVRSDYAAALGVPFDQTPTTYAEVTPAQRQRVAAWEKSNRGVERTTVVGSGGGGQAPSGQLPSEIAIAANRALTGARLPVAERQSVMSTVQQYHELGDMDGLRSYLQQVALAGEPAAIKDRQAARMETHEALKDAKAIISQLRAAGVNTGFFQGGAERAAQALGKSTNPALARLGTQLNTILMNYRRGITGAAFSASENAEYTKIWPNISSDFALNEARIDGLVELMEKADADYWKRKFGDSGYKLIIGGNEVDTDPKSPTFGQRKGGG